MRRIVLLAFIVCVSLGLAGCRTEAPRSSGGMVQSADSFSAENMKPSDMALNREKFGNRRIAEKHSLRIENDPDDLKFRYDRDFKACLDMGCEIVSSEMRSRDYARINARISPDQLGAYLDFLGEGVGEVKSHKVSADDKTLEYIDVDSKIKSKEALRVRLLALMDNTANAKIEDILSVERELNRVEQELDSAKGQLNHLKTITGKATVNVNYNVPYYARDIDIHYRDISNSFKRAWKTLLDSLSSVIIFIGGIIPWIPIFFVGIWVVVRAFRFAFGRNFTLLFWRKKTKDVDDKKATK